MAKGYLIAVGASLVDGAAYGTPGHTYALPGVADDALAVSDRATAAGLAVAACLTGVDASTAKFNEALGAVAALATADDLVVLYFSGHGTLLQATSIYEDPTSSEVSDIDAALCFYDRPFIDDEMGNVYAKFGAGTRLLVMLDACYAGGMDDGLEAPPLASQGDPAVAPMARRAAPPRRLPSALERAFFDWRTRGRESLQVSLDYARGYDKLLPFHVAEFGFIANLPTYRRELPHRRWPTTLAHFNSDAYVSAATRNRIQLAPKAVRDALLTAAFARDLAAAEGAPGVRQWSLEGPHRSVVVDVVGGVIPHSARGSRKAALARRRSHAPTVSGPQVQMLCATGDSLAKQGVFTPLFLALQPGFAGSHVSFVKQLDENVRALVGAGSQSVTRSYSRPEPTTFTLQAPWQVA